MREKWDNDKEQWLTKEAYESQIANRPQVVIQYNHIHENGLKISDKNEGIQVGFGEQAFKLNTGGLSHISFSWHTFDAQPKQVMPMPLDEALALADKCRWSPTWLLSAELVYSNLTNVETDNQKYDLHWLLTTPYARYYINCVTRECWADYNWIQIPEGVLLPTAEQMNQRYTATLILGEQQLRFDDFVHLLGEDAQPVPGTEQHKQRHYQSVGHTSEMPRKLRERLPEERKGRYRGFSNDGLDYGTGTSINEGGPERKASPIGLSTDEVIALCTQELLPIFEKGYLSYAGFLEGVRKQWDYEKNWWQTQEAYDN